MQRSASKLTSLGEAVAEHVRPGMHLHFASTPSRSNAAILEVAKRFKNSNPAFTLSTSGFHSLAHLLGLLRLGQHYIACFYGDNYPTPRPNALYSQLEAEGYDLEHYSLATYVAALKAGAQGTPYTMVRSLQGTDLGRDLARRGRFVQVANPADESEPLGMVAAIRPDITFVHAAAGDAAGNVISSPPYSEGFWSAHGARRGVIVTVEQTARPEQIAQLPEALQIPAHRVLAVCVAPFGAHPQPHFALPSFDATTYPDDFAHYRLWRKLTREPAALDDFVHQVLEADDVLAAYRHFVGEERLATLRRHRPAQRAPSPRASLQQAIQDPAWAPNGSAAAADATDRLVIVAARAIAKRLRSAGHRTMLAGIGRGFLAARMAKLWLAAENYDVAAMVETGLYDLACGPESNDFLLSFAHMHLARRLSCVDDVLGCLTCGSDNHCMGVVGAAQVDVDGNINSTRLANGRLLVGSGGAADICAAAAEVTVVVPCDAARIVNKVDYVTSPGRHVVQVATELGVLERRDPARSEWHLTSVYPPADLEALEPAAALQATVQRIREHCPWPLHVDAQLALAPRASRDELRLMHALRSTYAEASH